MVPRPTALKPDDIPPALMCSICHDVPFPLRITPCEHTFCKECIGRALDKREECPYCRSPCKSNQLKSLKEGTVLHRIWSRIEVRSTNMSCTWTGPIGDYVEHVESWEQRVICDIEKESIKLEKLRRKRDKLSQEILERTRNLKEKENSLKYRYRNDYLNYESGEDDSSSVWLIPQDSWG